MKITHVLPTIFVSALTLSVFAPVPASALSCLAPFEHIPLIVEDGDYDIFTGEILDVSENESGVVTELSVSVVETLQGDASGVVDVQYEYDDTWAYLCTNAPGDVGNKETFIVRPSDDETPYVVYSFDDDSQLKVILMEALDGTSTPIPVEPTTPTEPTEEPDRNLMFQIIELLEELLSLLQLR